MITIYGSTNDRGGDVVKIEGSFRAYVGVEDEPFVESHFARNDLLSIDAVNHYVELVVGAEPGGVLVSLGVGDNGWCLAFELVDSEMPIPWPVQVTTRGVSPAVIIDCPPATVLGWIRTEKLPS